MAAATKQAAARVACIPAPLPRFRAVRHDGSRSSLRRRRRSAARPTTRLGPSAMVPPMTAPRLRRLAMGAAALALVASLPATAGAAPQPRASVHRALERFVREHPSFPGVAVSITTPHGSWTDAAGRAKAGDGVRVASNTKTFTAAAVLRLVEQHRVALDAPVATYLAPETVATLTAGGYDVPAMTVRHLLQHTSGLYDYAADNSYEAAVVAD